jgi:hypothetical protein
VYGDHPFRRSLTDGLAQGPDLGERGAAKPIAAQGPAMSYRRLFSAALLSFALAAPALADGDIEALLSDADDLVLDEFDARRTAALAALAANPDAGAQAALAEALSGNVLPFDEGFDATGNWRCRILKLGRGEMLTVYDWFSCRIFDDEASWVLQKTSGSQRTMGRFYQLDEDRLLYLGALHYGYEEPLWWGDDPERNHLAVTTRLDDGRIRLEFPAPLAESDFDILELKR